jgi:hypothetical protein
MKKLHCYYWQASQWTRVHVTFQSSTLHFHISTCCPEKESGADTITSCASREVGSFELCVYHTSHPQCTLVQVGDSVFVVYDVCSGNSQGDGLESPTLGVLRS